jgi:hypothetical protein
MANQQLNSLVMGRAAGSSFGVPDADLGRLSIIAYAIANPVLAIVAARSMAEQCDKPGDHGQSAHKNGAIETAQFAADYAEDAKDAAEKSEKAAGGSQQQAEAAALEARNAAESAQKAAATAQQAVSDVQKAASDAQKAASDVQKAAEAINAAKSGVLVQQVKK